MYSLGTNHCYIHIAYICRQVYQSKSNKSSPQNMKESGNKAEFLSTIHVNINIIFTLPPDSRQEEYIIIACEQAFFG